MKKITVLLAIAFALSGCGITGFLKPSIMNKAQNPTSIVCDRDYTVSSSCIEAAQKHGVKAQ